MIYRVGANFIFQMAEDVEKITYINSFNVLFICIRNKREFQTFFILFFCIISYSTWTFSMVNSSCYELNFFHVSIYYQK